MAVEQFKQATTLDPYLAIAFFQLGVSCFLLGRFEEALSNFGRSLTLLRENEKINYKQLGLDYQLCLCEVLFNRGLCHMYLQRPEQGMQDLKVAAGRKQHERHDVIDEAIQEEADVSARYLAQRQLRGEMMQC
ncbi:hypothetical protein KEM55_001372 [Ascosphaera atra]|nr:hypothetical protein KEM55_001372 [Ascosphaera atra]